MKRSKHSLSHSHLTTLELGRLVPVGMTEVLPGDTIQHATSAFIRVTPLVAPVMHPVSVRLHHWFVPNRLVWEGWEDFITGGPDGIGGDAGAYPTVTAPAGTGFQTGSIADYLGLPLDMPGIVVNAMPFRAYALIFNEFYRDEDLQPELDVSWNGTPAHICWEKDYFTSARPWPQKGPAVNMPLGVEAPVVGRPATAPTFLYPNNTTIGNLVMNSGQTGLHLDQGNSSVTGFAKWSDPGLVADLSNATAVNVNQVRLAFALQRYQEARARYGSRYTEYLRYLGVTPSDARLQRPEYLGGGKQVISFSEVLQTGPGTTEGSPVPGGVGQMAGHGVAGMRSASYRRFFEEHGYVFSLMSVRPRTMYQQGIDRTWSRRTKEDYWQRELEQIGQQEIKKKEIYAVGTSGTGDDAVWGYQDRYAEYKHHRNFVSGEFKNILDYWHYGRKFTGAPALNSDFVMCDPTVRVYQEQTQSKLYCAIQHSIQARRMVSKTNRSRIM